MTLIISCTTHRYVVLVADRRLTRVANKKLELGDDDANKIICFENRLAIAYTGLACLDRKRTDQWIAEAIQTATTTDQIVEFLASKAEQAIQRLRLQISPNDWQMLGHAFSIVGWEENADNENYGPLAIAISNNEDSNGNNLPTVSHTFSVRRHRLSSAELVHIESAGQKASFTHHMETQIRGRLRTALRKGKAGVPPVVAIARTIRSVALNNPAVGMGILGVVLPRMTSSPEYAFGTFAVNEPSNDTPWFIEFRTDNDRTIQHSPIYVNRSHKSYPEQHIISRMEIVYGEPVDKQPENIVPAPLPSAMVLSSWKFQPEIDTFMPSILGTWIPTISDEYSLDSYSVMTDTRANKSGGNSPYYGTLVAISTDASTLEQIRADSRYFIVSEPSYQNYCPSSQWHDDLGKWFHAQGMPNDEVVVLLERLKSHRYSEIDLALRYILSVPKSGSQDTSEM